MTDNKAVMQQALAALEVSHKVLRNSLVIEDAIVAIRAAIAQLVQNFCARCGKRLAGDGIHTCTLPKPTL